MWQLVGRYHILTGKQNFMDALREQYEGGFKMSAYKDKTQGNWYVSSRYIDWTGKKTQKLKRGVKTKKEALNYEKKFIRKTAADMKMERNSFIQVYFEDKKNELKENSIRNKEIIGKVSFSRKRKSMRTQKGTSRSSERLSEIFL